MANRRTIRTVTTELPQADNEERDFLPERGRVFEHDSAEDEIAALSGEGPDSGRVTMKLYRIISGDPQFLTADFNPPAGNIEGHIQDCYPDGGKFFIKYFFNGLFKKNSQVFNIAAKPKEAGAVAPAQSAGSTVETMLREQNAMLMKLVLDGRSQATPISELLAGMGALDQLRGGGSQSNMLELIKLGMTLSGKEPEDDSFMSVIKTIAPQILPGVVASLTQKPGMPIPEKVDLPAVPSSPAAMMSEAEMKSQQAAALRPLFAYLKAQAVSQSDPTLQVAWAEDNYRLPMVQELIVFVQNTTWEEILAIDPEVKKEPYATYFKSLFDGLRSAFAPENPMAVDTARSGGNKKNANGHAGTGAPGRGSH